MCDCGEEEGLARVPCPGLGTRCGALKPAQLAVSHGASSATRFARRASQQLAGRPESGQLDGWHPLDWPPAGDRLLSAMPASSTTSQKHHQHHHDLLQVYADIRRCLRVFFFFYSVAVVGATTDSTWNSWLVTAVKKTLDSRLETPRDRGR